MTAPPIDPRRVEYLPLADLAPDPRNPKGHDHNTIGASIGRFGYLEPIVRDERTGYIISGHGRAQVLTDMAARGENPPEGVRPTPAGEWLVPVVVGWASRTDTEAAAALIALNRTTELGGWVDDALLELLDEIAATGNGSLDGIGFDEDEIADLRKTLDNSVDLDGLADEWDGESGLAPREETTSIEITDPGLAAAWALYRANHPTDTIALATLMSSAGVPTVVPSTVQPATAAPAG